MLKVKINKKILVTLGIMLVLIFIFSMNTIKAAEITEDQLQAMIDVIPDEISLDIPEIEYEKANELIEQKIKEIWQSNNMSAEGINISADEIQLYFLDIHKTDIRINSDVKKTISILYNNTNQKNTTDEQYVKNLMNQVTTIKYCETDLDFIDNIKIDQDFKKIDTMIANSYINQINDNSVIIKVAAGSGGGSFLNRESICPAVAIFKNEILYYLDDNRREDVFIIPTINVPSTVADNEVKNYVINLIKPYYEKEGLEIDRIDKGTKDKKEYGLDIDVPNGYTVYLKNGYCEYIIVKGKEINDTTTSTMILLDNETKVQLEAGNGIVPDDTILEVKKIMEKEILNDIKILLGDKVKQFELFDITLKSKGVEIQPNGKVKISIPIPNNFYTTNLAIYRIEDNGNKIRYDAKTVGSFLQFETDHFSKYVIAEIEQDSNEKDDTPKTGAVENIYYILPIIFISALGIIAFGKKETK